jgi:hypothetical protein
MDEQLYEQLSNYAALDEVCPSTFAEVIVMTHPGTI